MTEEEIRQFLLDVKAIYPTFQSVEKKNGFLSVTGETVKAWHRQIGWMSRKQADGILSGHMHSDKGDKAPTLRTWLAGGGNQSQGSGKTMWLDRAHNVIIWQPEGSGKRYEIPVKRYFADGSMEDIDGRLYGFQG